MSLPMANSPINQDNENNISIIESAGTETTRSYDNSGTGTFSIGNISLLSPLRKMDFALCKCSQFVNPTNKNYSFNFFCV